MVLEQSRSVDLDPHLQSEQVCTIMGRISDQVYQNSFALPRTASSRQILKNLTDRLSIQKTVLKLLVKLSQVAGANLEQRTILQHRSFTRSC